jgi:hypothetical protein
MDDLNDGDQEISMAELADLEEEKQIEIIENWFNLSAGKSPSERWGMKGGNSI